MIPFITAEQLRERLDIGAMVESMRAAHRRPVPLMERVLMQPDGPNSYLVWHAWQPGDVVVTKMGTIFPGNAALPAPLPAVQALVMVFDGTDGAPVAIIDGTELTYWKTATSSLLAAQCSGVSPCGPANRPSTGAPAATSTLTTSAPFGQ
mgnify:CR=1 FL=1